MQAQKDLTTARIAAKQSLEDLSNEVIDNGLAQRQAAITLEQAKRTLDTTLRAPGATLAQYAPQVAAAQLAFDQAKQQSDELRLKGERLAAQRDAANKAGVDGAAN